MDSRRKAGIPCNGQLFSAPSMLSEIAFFLRLINPLRLKRARLGSGNLPVFFTLF